jgi:type IV secretion system protein VirB10
MLEHGTEPEIPSTPTGAPTAAPEETFYIPPGRAEPLTGRGKPPGVKRFNRKMLIVMGAVASIVVTLALSVGLQRPKPKNAAASQTVSRTPAPNDAVNGLPATYADGIPQLGDPRPGDVGTLASPPTNTLTGLDAHGAPRTLSPVEQYAQQQELDRLHKEDAARTAGVSFTNAGGGEAGSESPSGLGAAPGFQERLLDLAQHGGAPAPSPVTATYREEADPSGQSGKIEFAERPRGQDFNLHAKVEAPRSPNTLFAGTILPCVLTQGINSDLPGQIGCLISQNVYDTITGKLLLIPQGTRAIGTYDSHVAYGQDRVLVVWTRLLRPDGSTLSLEGMPGTDLSGYAGLTGHVNNHYLRLLSGVVLGSLIGASAQIATGANSQNPSFAALAVQGAGQNFNEAGQQITRKNLNIQPTIEVPPGARLNIFATKDLILPPWKD